MFFEGPLQRFLLLSASLHIALVLKKNIDLGYIFWTYKEYANWTQANTRLIRMKNYFSVHYLCINRPESTVSREFFYQKLTFCWSRSKNGHRRSAKAFVGAWSSFWSLSLKKSCLKKCVLCVSNNIIFRVL